MILSRDFLTIMLDQRESSAEHADITRAELECRARERAIDLGLLDSFGPDGELLIVSAEKQRAALRRLVSLRVRVAMRAWRVVA